MSRKKVVRLDGFGNEIKILKKERRNKREKRFSKGAKVKKKLLKEICDKKETQMIENEIADYLKARSNGYHIEIQKKELPADQNNLKSTVMLSHENEKDSKNPSWFFWISWRWLKKVLWWSN